MSNTDNLRFNCEGVRGGYFRVPVNKELLTGTVPVNDLFHDLKGPKNG